MAEEKRSLYKKRQKDLILKALTNPSFRKLLMNEPAKALDKKITVEIQKEIKMVLAVVKGIEAQIANLADMLLCVNGPCGIA